MPDLPKYYARITPKPVGKAPIPLAAADVGAGAIGAGLQQVGRGLDDIGQDLFQVELEKQIVRDNASLASANGDYDKSIADKINEARRTTFTSIEQFTEFRKQVEADLDAQVKSSIGKMSSRAGQSFSNFAKNNKQNSLRQVEGIVWQKEVEFGQADTQRQYSNKFEVLAGAGASVEDILKDPSLKIIETGMSPYWRAGELDKVRDRTLIDALVNVGRYDDATELAKSTKAFTSTERKAYLNKIRVSKNLAESIANQALDIQQEADRNKISELIKASKSAESAIQSSALDETEQWIWSERERVAAERRAKGTIIETNQRAKGSLESMAYDISTGAVTMPEFKKRLTEERYDKETIDDSAYDELFSLAERKFESYQAGAMKEREVYALGQLVTYPSEAGLAEKLATMLSQFDKDQIQVLRQLQFDNLDQYKRALRRLLEKPENKDVDADWIYTEGRKLLVHYRKTPDQLRKGVEPPELEVTPLSQKQREKMGRSIQEALIKGLTGQPKAKKSISDIPEPKNKREFINKLRELEGTNPELGAEYYKKYLDKFW